MPHDLLNMSSTLAPGTVREKQIQLLGFFLDIRQNIILKNQISKYIFIYSNTDHDSVSRKQGDYFLSCSLILTTNIMVNERGLIETTSLGRRSGS